MRKHTTPKSGTSYSPSPEYRAIYRADEGRRTSPKPWRRRVVGFGEISRDTSAFKLVCASCAPSGRIVYTMLAQLAAARTRAQRRLINRDTAILPARLQQIEELRRCQQQLQADVAAMRREQTDFMAETRDLLRQLVAAKNYSLT